MTMPENDVAAPRPERNPFRLARHWSWTATLLVVYVLVFIAERVVLVHFPHSHFFSYLALSRQGINHGYFWQLLTYQFLHGGWVHLFFNGWAIFTFGRELERRLGAGRYLALLFASGIEGGILQMLTAAVWPWLFDGPVVGASACAFGLVAAYAAIFPEDELLMLVFYVIPIKLRVRTLLILSVVLATMGIIFPWNASLFPSQTFPWSLFTQGSHVANAAHLGGMIMGWFFIKRWIKPPVLPKPA